MENKKIIWGGLAGGVVFFLLGFVFYGLLLKDFFEAQVTLPGAYKEVPDFLPLVIGNLAQGFLLALIIGKWTNSATAAEGFKNGLFVGLLIAIGVDFITLGVTNLMNMTGALADIGIVGIMCAIVGAIQAMIMGTSRKTVTA